MYSWNAKIHKSGSKVAIFNGNKLIKVVEASAETFEPAEAQKFAEKLLGELETRTAGQMTETSGPVTVETKAESHEADMSAVNSQATGKAPHMKGSEPAAPTTPVTEPVAEEEEKEEAPVAAPTDEEKNENEACDTNEKKANVESYKKIIASLKNKLAQEKNERTIERKARRGLAIAKDLVASGRLDDSYDSIRNKVAEIVKLEDSEIERLERKVAGEQEFDSVEDAVKEARRQSRIARMYRQAAAEAQEDGCETEADQSDKNADEAEAKEAHIKSVIAEMKENEEETKNCNCEEKEECCEKKAEAKEETPAKDAPAAAPVAEEKPAEVKEEKKPVEEDKKAAAEETKSEEVKPTKVEPEEKEEVDDEEGKKADLTTLARKYRRIASQHRKLAAEAEEQGNIEDADKQDKLADDAEENAENIENKMNKEKKAEAKEEVPVKDEAAEKEVEEEKKVAAEEVKPEEVKPTEEKDEKAKEPEGAAKVSIATALKREGEEVSDSFGIDKNACLVEQNEYSSDPEVDLLSNIWHGAPKDLD
jgi:hypothetical protein